MTSPFLIDSTVNVPFVFTSQNLNVLFAQIALARLLPPFLLIRDASPPLGLRNLGLGPLLSTLCCYHTYWIFWFSLGSLQHVTLSRPLKPCLFLTRPAFWNLCPLGSGILGLGQMLGLLPLCFVSCILEVGFVFLEMELPPLLWLARFFPPWAVRVTDPQGGWNWG